MFQPVSSPVGEGARQSLNGDPFERLPVVGEGAHHGTRGGRAPHFQLNRYLADSGLSPRHLTACHAELVEQFQLAPQLRARDLTEQKLAVF